MPLEDDLRRALNPTTPTVLARGQAEADPAGGVRVVIGGARPPVRALGVVNLKVGDSCACVLIGQQWYVLGVSTDRLSPLPVQGRVTAVTGGSPTVTVTDTDDQTWEARFVGAAPSVGQDVALDWPAGEGGPRVLGVVGTVTAPTTPTAPPAPDNPTPIAAETGTEHFTATDSGTWTITEARWNTTFGRHLHQGTWSPRSYRGAWFYGGAPTATLTGKTATAARVRLPARRRVGNYNAPATVHLYLHGNTTKGGDPVPTSTVHDIVIPAGYQGGWHDLPAGFAVPLATGSGLVITGDPYTGLTGAGPTTQGYDPASGQIALDWTRS